MKILLLDDHAIFLDGLTLLLNSQFPESDIVACHSGQEAIQQIEISEGIDLMLIDLDMPDINGLAFIEQCRDKRYCIPFALLSATDNKRDVDRGLELGAAGYIAKSASSSELKEAIESILTGDVYVSATEWPELKGVDEKISNDYGLTDRQKEIVHYLVQGLSNKAIAYKLMISSETIKSHLKIIYQKMGVSNRTECVRLYHYRP